MTDSTLLLAQAAQTDADPLLSMLPIALVFGIFYFVLILPMRNKQKKLDHLQQTLKAGDKIILNPGIFGTVVAIEGDALHIRIADQTKVKVLRSAVAGLQGPPETDKTEKK